MKTYTPQTKTRGGYGLTATFILAALLIVLVVLYSARHTEPKPKQYGLKIMELGGESMLAHSDSEELGLGEILLVYDKDMVVEDVNGQIIDFAELGIEDGIRVEIAPREKDPDYDRYLDPVVKRIILLPDDSDDYVSLTPKSLSSDRSNVLLCSKSVISTTDHCAVEWKGISSPLKAI